MKRTMENRAHTLWRTAHASHFRFGEAHMLSVQEMWLHPRKRRCESGMCEPQDVTLANAASFLSPTEKAWHLLHMGRSKNRSKEISVCVFGCMVGSSVFFFVVAFFCVEKCPAFILICLLAFGLRVWQRPRTQRGKQQYTI